MSHFRDVVASMVKSLKEQYGQILSNTTKVNVTRGMVKFQVELDILTQYVNSQSIDDVNSNEQTAAIGHLGDNDQNDNNSNAPGMLETPLKEEIIPAKVAVNIQSDKIFPMVKLINQPIYDEICSGDIKIYGTATSKSFRISPRNNDDDEQPPGQDGSICEDMIRPIKRRRMTVSHSLKKFQCVNCPKRYRSIMGLRFHVETKHPKTGGEPARFNCDECAASYAYVGALRTHKKNKHENQSEAASSNDHKS